MSGGRAVGDAIFEPKFLRIGTYLGEIGVLLPRTKCLSTVVAFEDSTLLRISKEDWARVISREDALLPGGSKIKAGERNLHFNLQLDLLIRLRRSQVRGC